MLKEITLLILCLCLTNFAHARISATASVDRNHLSMDETLRLTIKIDDTGTYSTPTLKVLEQDFDVLGSNQSSRHSIINGKSSSVTEWTFTLSPKHEGKLLIPSIKINDAKTAPISITVNKRTPLHKGQLEPVFIETDISHKQAYIDQQIIFTLRIFHSVQLESLNLSDFEVETARSKKVGQNSFVRTINGVQHRVHEITYAIFPEKTGPLTIPSQTFTASPALSRRSYQSNNTSLIRRSTDNLIINIKEKPQSFAKLTWLPSKNFTLSESWSNNPEKIHVGESLTRTITQQAEGLMASQLPPINFSSPKGAKLYPDQAETSNSETPSGINGQRIDSTALIATTVGEITLPVIKVPWWNTETNRLEVAHIAEKTIIVLPATDQEKVTNGAAFDNRSTTVTQPQIITIKESNPFWMWLSLILALLWLITLLAYVRLSRKNDNPSKQKTNELSINTEKQAFKRLQLSCKNNEIDNIRPHLIQWAKYFWPSATINCFEDIIDVSQNYSLQALLQEYDHSLYSGTTSTTIFNGQNLLTVIKEIRTHKKTKPITSELPDLYAQ